MASQVIDAPRPANAPSSAPTGGPRSVMVSFGGKVMWG